MSAKLRAGARRLLAGAVEAEAEAFLAAMRGLRLPDGRERVVRLKGENQLPEVIQGVKFTSGVGVTNTPAQSAA
jgi:hypothetical protein